MSISVKPVAPISGEGSTKTLRQLQAEEDDEERFQADLKKAVRQSLGNVHTAFTYACFLLLHYSYKCCAWDWCLETNQSYLVNVKNYFSMSGNLSWASISQ